MQNTTYHKETIALAFTGIVMLFAGAVLPATTYAQDGIGIKIQPSTIEERVDPGAVLEGTLTVTNEDGGRQTYFLGTRNIAGMNENGTPSFSESSSIDSMEAATWIAPLMESVTLDVGQSQEVPYRIAVPAEASPGSYFAAIFVTREAGANVDNGAGVGFHVASLINLRVNGEVIDDMMVREFFTNASFYKKPEVAFKARIENTGTIYQRPQGVITITDMLGNEVGSVLVNESEGGIMPRNDRVFEMTWTHDSFALGKYTALLSVLYGDVDRKTETRVVTFWIVPVKELGIVLGGIVLLVLLIVSGLRAYVRKELKRAGHTGSSASASVQVTFARRVSRTLLRLLVVLAIGFVGMLVFFG
ncbi:MAG: hypothetical protein KBD24_01910 [Candidatus Pacebacteria bacterium]|nr:hypothetical protein [Candidatus Paceibacterota bacterium]